VAVDKDEDEDEDEDDAALVLALVLIVVFGSVTMTMPPGVRGKRKGGDSMSVESFAWCGLSGMVR